MRKDSRIGELPEVTRYTNYYEHDGMLRAYANRSMLLAMIFGVLSMASLGFAIYVRIQPPTVIRIDKDGNASVAGGARPGSLEGPVYLSTTLLRLRCLESRLQIWKAERSCANFSVSILPIRRSRSTETWLRH